MLRVKRLTPNAQLPTRAHPLDAGYDLYTTAEVTLNPGERAAVPTGIAIQVPHSHVGSIRPRSGLAYKHGITVLNSPGTIDGGYTGEVQVILYNTSKTPYKVVAGDRIAQLVLEKIYTPSVLEVDTLTSLDGRDSGKFGSSGV